MTTRFAALFAATLFCAPASAGTYVFGDSSVEQGNLYALPGQGRTGSPYFTKDGFSRESNGPVWIEYLVPGIKPVLGAAKTDTKVNFAYSGATSGRDNIAVTGAGGLADQVSAFQARIAAGSPRATPGDLFVVAAGTNDFIRDLGGVDLRTTSTGVISNLTTAAGQLAPLGATRILIEDIPNFILAPEFNELVPASERKELVEVLSQFVTTHNAAQVEAVAKLNGELATTDVVTVPVSKLFDHVRANATALGFKVIDKACFEESTGKLCSTDPAIQNSYLFFDNLHLTTRAQSIQADYYAALLGQLEGRANRVAASLGRDAATIMRAEATNERAARHSSWTSPIANRGLSVLGDAEYSEVKDDQVLVSNGHREAYRFGLGYSDGKGWSVRLVGARQLADLQHEQGAHNIEGWSVVASGERRWGNFRLGASAGEFYGNVQGTRAMPVALMSADYRTRLHARTAELEAGLVFGEGHLQILPSMWARYEKGRFSAFEEEGSTGLEMAFPRHKFEAVYAGAAATLAYRATEAVTPQLSVSHEARITSGTGEVVGVLVGNSADPVAERVNVFAQSRTVVQPSVDVRIAKHAALNIGGYASLGDRDLGARARLTFRF